MKLIESSVPRRCDPADEADETEYYCPINTFQLSQTSTTPFWSHIWRTKETVLITFCREILLVPDLLSRTCIIMESRIYPRFSHRRAPTFVLTRCICGLL
jgi:hypothetical protein